MSKFTKLSWKYSVHWDSCKKYWIQWV